MLHHVVEVSMDGGQDDGILAERAIAVGITILLTVRLGRHP